MAPAEKPEPRHRHYLLHPREVLGRWWDFLVVNPKTTERKGNPLVLVLLLVQLVCYWLANYTLYRYVSTNVQPRLPLRDLGFDAVPAYGAVWLEVAMNVVPYAAMAAALFTTQLRRATSRPLTCQMLVLSTAVTLLNYVTQTLTVVPDARGGRVPRAAHGEPRPARAPRRVDLLRAQHVQHVCGHALERAHGAPGDRLRGALRGVLHARRARQPKAWLGCLHQSSGRGTAAPAMPSS